MIQLDTLYNQDCLIGMKDIPDGTVDCIICDLPYGTTAHKWDCVIPFEPMWDAYRRIIKKDGVIVLFATQPFTSMLISSNLKDYRYSWIWEKNTPTGFLNANYAPLKLTEDICVFSPFTTVGSLSKNPIRYYPQGIKEVNRVLYNDPKSTYRKSQGYGGGKNVLNSGKEYVQRYEGYPTNLLKYPRDRNNIHPTQKPVELIRYLIRTYTSKGDLVLDNCVGSGTTLVAAILEGRHYIGYEINEDYYNLACKRIKDLK